MSNVIVSGSTVTATVAASRVSVARVSAPKVSVAAVAQSVGVVAIRGPAGAPGDAAAYLTATTVQPISGHMVVLVDDFGHMVYASAAQIDHAARPLAMTTGAWPAGASATARLMGLISEPSWSWTPGAPVWLGDNGLPTQELPADAVFQRQIAEVITPTTIFVDVRQAIILA